MFDCQRVTHNIVDSLTRNIEVPHRDQLRFSVQLLLPSMGPISAKQTVYISSLTFEIYFTSLKFRKVFDSPWLLRKGLSGWCIPTPLEK